MILEILGRQVTARIRAVVLRGVADPIALALDPGYQDGRVLAEAARPATRHVEPLGSAPGSI